MQVEKNNLLKRIKTAENNYTKRLEKVKSDMAKLISNAKLDASKKIKSAEEDAKDIYNSIVNSGRNEIEAKKKLILNSAKDDAEKLKQESKKRLEKAVEHILKSFEAELNV